MERFDTVIVGSGLAGLTVALHLAAHQRVALVTKRSVMDGASAWAQGGIAAVLSAEDSPESHIRDTLVAGAGLCNEQVTRFVVGHGREAIEWLIAQGVPFTRDSGAALGFHLTREGGHSVRRVIHAADATGHAVQSTLTEKAAAHPNITVLEHHIAVDLITGAKLGRSDNRCHGLYALDAKAGQVKTIKAGNVVLASGGAGKVYLYTTNPDTSTGDGIAMGWRAGCRVANMEFIQFHPTCLYHPAAKSFLISEALRGEGAILRRPDGEPFMKRYHADAELAPRDIVARAIDNEMKVHGYEHVYLDITHRGADFVRQRFPSIHEKCLTFGIDITAQPIPVVPAAHYCCGGAVTDSTGATAVRRLFAAGEVAMTGLHGANRLASNSLLEATVFGHRSAIAACRLLAEAPRGIPDLPAWNPGRAVDSDESVVVTQNWDEIRRLMW
ncbi:MAG TPA: L-aspartate oxidase, partial [Burkholderiales bacterium]|nr:L-aspartate oxidase [Burkholderiales bacterium]